MELAARQFLRAIRGKRSQLAFARRLGYRGNPIANWEAGRRTPTMDEALRACVRVGIDVDSAFGRFHQSVPASPTQAASLAQWLDGLRGSTSITEVAARVGRPRHTISRWLSAECRPRVHEFLKLLDALTGSACDLVAALVPIEQVPELRVAHEARSAARRLAHEEPWTEAILRVLESLPYVAGAVSGPAYGGQPYREGEIAAQLGIDVETEKRCIEKLLRAGIVTRAGGDLRVAEDLTVDTRAVPQLKVHWSKVACERLSAPRDEDLFSYNVLSVAPDDLVLIRERLRAAYREIRAIVSNSSSTERVALVNLQLVNWGHGTELPPSVEAGELNSAAGS